MKRRFGATGTVIAVLFALGVLYQFALAPGQLLIPLIVFGAVFLLWKFPPNRLKKLWNKPKVRNAPHVTIHRLKPKQTRNRVPFRVIPGNKKDGRERDRPNTYH